MDDLRNPVMGGRKTSLFQRSNRVHALVGAQYVAVVGHDCCLAVDDGGSIDSQLG